MTLVTIATNDTAITGDLRADVTTTSQAARRHGEATLRVPRAARAWAAGVLRRDGGMLVRCDGFTGVADAPTWSPEGAEVRALAVTQWVALRPVGTGLVFRSVPAGVIARRAVDNAFTGLGAVPVTLGALAVGPPLIPEYRFEGQLLGDVLADLQEQTGHEWTIDPATLAFAWQAQLGRYHEVLLTDLDDLLRVLQVGALGERYRETHEVDARTGRDWVALDGTVPVLWPSARTERL